IDGPVATTSTVLTLHLSEMTPFAEGDQISISSFSTGANVSVDSISIPAGATTFDRDIDWAAVGKPLLSAARGDDLYVIHSHRETQAPHVVSFAVVDAFAASNVTLTNGQPANVTGSFAPPTLSGMQQFFVDAASFLDGMDAPNHMPVSIAASLQGASSTQATVVRIGGQFTPGAGA